MGSFYTNKLTELELDAIQRASVGESQTKTAREYGVSTSVINTRRERAFRKLGVHTAAHAVAVCLARGLIVGPSE